MKKLNPILFLLPGILIVLSSCRQNSVSPTDTPTSGTIKVGIDQTILPIIQEEIDVFESLYTTAGIIEVSCPEVELFNLLLKDSLRMVVVSRMLTPEETNYFNGKKIFPRELKIAVDGIALIVNKANSDTLISTEMVRKILIGEITSWDQIYPKSKLGTIKVIFDNPNSSTAEFAVKSICNNQKLSGQLSALNNNSEVIEYVSKTENSLGIIGVSWISSHIDSSCMGFSDKVRVMAISKESNVTSENSFQPYQAYFATGQYPYTRNLYAIVTDPRVGLATGFTSFIASDRGQRIILKSGILPTTQPLRLIHVNDNY
jgi:phosphate transport system substrate-binding protein